MLESLTLQPVARFDGEINLPGSKSVSNRALLLAAMAQGTTRLTNLLDSDDVRHMLNALKTLGVHFQLSDCRTICDVESKVGDSRLLLPLRSSLAMRERQCAHWRLR